MTNDINEPQARPDGIKPDTGEGHDSGLERSPSEPKQGTGEKLEDWNPPVGNPGSDQDAQTNRGNGGA
ncbi:hypothetical protein EC915_10415 [Pseudomonas sp. LP_7_YM]|nr:hypothetical protein EC915_10415 [Pseudomonas sp. LP_7_YM]